MKTTRTRLACPAAPFCTLPSLIIILLFAISLFMPWQVQAQYTPIYENTFDSKSSVTYEVSEGIGNSSSSAPYVEVKSSLIYNLTSALHTSYKGYVFIQTNQSLDPRFMYHLSLRLQVTGSDAKLKVTTGTTKEEARSQMRPAMQNDKVSTNSNYQTLSSYFTVSEADSPLIVGVYVESLGDMPLVAKHIRIDDLIISKGCFTVAAPTPTGGSRQGSGSVTLTAAGATTGQSYRWYTADNTLIPGQTASSYTTPYLTSTTVYRVAIAQDDTGCESDKQEVTAEICSKKEMKPSLEIDWAENDTKWNVTASEAAFGPGAFGSNPTYEWYRRESYEMTPDGAWGQPVQTGAQSTYTEPAPAGNVQLMAIVNNQEANTQYYMHNIDPSPLPVELLYFRAEQEGNKLRLQWSTASEAQNAGFAVEVSEDGQLYRKLAFVPSMNGDCQRQQYYTFTDTEGGKYGNRFYRLKQVDTQGTFHFSQHLKVILKQPFTCIQVAPNPTSGGLVQVTLNAEKAGDARLQVLNLAGVMVYQKVIPLPMGTSTEAIPLDPALPNGVYYLRTYLNGEQITRKLLKI